MSINATSSKAAAWERINARAALDRDRDRDHNHTPDLGDRDSESGSIQIPRQDPDRDHDKARKFERTHLLGIIHNDKYFRYAEKVLGTHRGTIVKACELLGLGAARDCIKLVHEMPDWRFEQGWRNKSMEPSARRGSYLMTCWRNQALILGRPWSSWRAEKHA